MIFKFADSDKEALSDPANCKFARAYRKLRDAGRACGASFVSLGEYIRDGWAASVVHHDLENADEPLECAGRTPEEAVHEVLRLLRVDLLAVVDDYDQQAHKAETHVWDLRHRVCTLEQFLKTDEEP